MTREDSLAVARATAAPRPARSRPGEPAQARGTIGEAGGPHKGRACRTRRGRPLPALHRRLTYLGDHSMSPLLVRTRGPWRAWRTSGPTIPVEIRDAAS